MHTFHDTLNANYYKEAKNHELSFPGYLSCKKPVLSLKAAAQHSTAQHSPARHSTGLTLSSLTLPKFVSNSFLCPDEKLFKCKTVVV